jgi:hypothetical protein
MEVENHRGDKQGRTLEAKQHHPRAPDEDAEAPGAYGSFSRADDGARTHDPQLGKLMLYQLSYVRADGL